LDVLSVDWHKDGRWVVTGEGGYRGAAVNSDISNVRIWDSTNGWLNYTLDTVPRRAYSVRFSPDGKFLAVGCAHEVRIYSLSPIAYPQNWRRVSTIIGFGIADINIEINSIDWSPDSTKLAVSVGGERSNKDGDPSNTVGDSLNPVGPDPFIYIYDLTKIPQGNGGEEAPLPVDCVGNWSLWSDCDCVSQLRFQVHTITIPVLNGGIPCDYLSGESLTEACVPSSCSPVDCVGTWSDWAMSSNGTLIRTFVIEKPKANGGTCPSEGLVEEKTNTSRVGRLDIPWMFLSYFSLVLFFIFLDN
jgi:WD40 repeat protein